MKLCCDMNKCFLLSNSTQRYQKEITGMMSKVLHVNMYKSYYAVFEYLL